MREKNFLGRGQDVGISFTLSQRSTEADLRFTEPYFLDRKLAAGFDIFRVTRERVRQIEAKAVRKLRHPVRARQLASLLGGVQMPQDAECGGLAP